MRSSTRRDHLLYLEQLATEKFPPRPTSLPRVVLIDFNNDDNALYCALEENLSQYRTILSRDHARHPCKVRLHVILDQLENVHRHGKQSSQLFTRSCAHVLRHSEVSSRS